jgi:hypothetical protein
MQTDTRHGSDARNAHTQNAFREVNEAITEVGGAFGLGEEDGQPMEVMGECGRPGCFARIELSAAAYEAIRSDGAHFVLVAGHEVGTVEHVVYRTESYVVAQNHGQAEAIARDADPRR